MSSSQPGEEKLFVSILKWWWGCWLRDWSVGLTALVFAMEMGMHGGWTLLLNGVEVGRSVEEAKSRWWCNSG